MTLSIDQITLLIELLEDFRNYENNVTLEIEERDKLLETLTAMAEEFDVYD